MSRRMQPVIAALLFLMFLVGCSAPNAASPTATTAVKTAEPSSSGGYQTLTVDAFADILAKNKSQYKIVNVHIPYEGEIEGTDAKIPYNDLNALMAGLPDKNAPIILSSRSGRMSEIACRALIEKGYTRVWDVSGGMIAWEASGRKIVNK